MRWLPKSEQPPKSIVAFLAENENLPIPCNLDYAVSSSRSMALRLNPPTHPECENRFRYRSNGRIEGLDEAAEQTIEHLKLNHATLVGWRRQAWETYLNLADEEAAELRSRLRDRQIKPVPEFAFVLESILVQLESGE